MPRRWLQITVAHHRLCMMVLSRECLGTRRQTKSPHHLLEQGKKGAAPVSQECPRNTISVDHCCHLHLSGRARRRVPASPRPHSRRPPKRAFPHHLAPRLALNPGGFSPRSIISSEAAPGSPQRDCRSCMATLLRYGADVLMVSSTSRSIKFSSLVNLQRDGQSDHENTKMYVGCWR